MQSLDSSCNIGPAALPPMQLHVTTVITLLGPRKMPAGHARKDDVLRQTALLVFLQFGEKAPPWRGSGLGRGGAETRRRTGGLALALRCPQGRGAGGTFPVAFSGISGKACHAGSGALMLFLDSRDPLARAYVYLVVVTSLTMTWRLVKWARASAIGTALLGLTPPGHKMQLRATVFLDLQRHISSFHPHERQHLQSDS